MSKPPFKVKRTIKDDTWVVDVAAAKSLGGGIPGPGGMVYLIFGDVRYTIESLRVANFSGAVVEEYLVKRSRVQCQD